MARKPLFVVRTPFWRIPVATLWDNTWRDHIIKGHPEVIGKLRGVQQTVQRPTLVCEATTPDYFTFVSHTDVDYSGNPLVVVVSTLDSSGTPAVATAYYGGKKYRNTSKLVVVWP